MAAGRGTAAAVAAGAALTADAELEVARAVHGALGIFAGTEMTFAQRLQRVAAELDLPLAKVRRYLALHLAPIEIQQMYREGLITAANVEMLQGFKPLRQVGLAMVLERGAGRSLPQIAQKVERSNGHPWTDEGRTFEKRLQAAIDILNPYFDAPWGQLAEVYRGIGSALGRRSVIEMIDRQISILGTLKERLERIDGVAEGEHEAHDATSAERC